jgi:hypothetical protein
MVGSKDASMPEMAGASLAPIASNGQVKILLSRDRRQSFERRERGLVIASSSTMTCDSELGARSLLGSIGRARRRWRPNQIQSLRNAELSADVSIHFPCRVRQVLRKRLFQHKHSDSVDFPVKVADLFAVLHTAPLSVGQSSLCQKRIDESFPFTLSFQLPRSDVEDSVCQKVKPRVTAAIAQCRLTMCLVKRA